MEVAQVIKLLELVRSDAEVEVSIKGVDDMHNDAEWWSIKDIQTFDKEHCIIVLGDCTMG